METILWALDLIAVLALCIWALRLDSGMPPKKKKVK